MNLHDPARPKSSSGLPGILPTGHYMVPILQIGFVEDRVDGIQWIRVSAWLPVEAYNNFRQFELTIPMSDIGDFLASFEADPEEGLDQFGWEQPAPNIRATLADPVMTADIASVMSKLITKPSLPIVERRL